MPEIIASSSGAITDASPSSSDSIGDSAATTHRIGDSENGQQNPEQTNGEPSSPEAKTEGRQHKRLSPYERVKRQKAALQQREASLKAREEQIANAEREKSAPQKPPYTVAELKQYRQSWEDEGRTDLVEKADKEIQRLEALEKQDHQSAAFVQEWKTAEKELFEADQEFMRPNTRLDSKLREIMGSADGQIYRGHPRGIVAAYHRAKMELLEGDYKAVTGENHQLKAELKRLTGLTSIGGGAPGRIGNGNRVENLNDFAKLSSADMLKHLKSKRSGQMPWL
jgi:hypothetical protein